jgi:hypothetical protein
VATGQKKGQRWAGPKIISLGQSIDGLHDSEGGHDKTIECDGDISSAHAFTF